jgi:hypothetical protein
LRASQWRKNRAYRNTHPKSKGDAEVAQVYRTRILHAVAPEIQKAPCNFHSCIPCRPLGRVGRGPCEMCTQPRLPELRNPASALDTVSGGRCLVLSKLTNGKLAALTGHVNSRPISLLRFRVPAVYLSSEFVSVLSPLPERRINNLRRLTGRRWFESHPLRQPVCEIPPVPICLRETATVGPGSA